MFKYFWELVFILVGLLILLFNNIYLASEFPFIVPILNVVGGLIAVIPPTLVFYARYKKRKEIEEQFIVFIRDLNDAINTGMTLPLALRYISKKDYLALSPYINDLAAQVDWGIPFEKSLKIFAKKNPSITIKRAINTIIETYKVGGKISDTLLAIGKSLITIDRIKKERSTSVKTQVVTSYMIYFIFIFILVVLQVFLIPSLNIKPSGVTGIAEVTVPSSELYSTSFVNFIIIQGLFAGLVTGKMSEGSIIAGFKHCILLIAIGYSIFSISLQFQFSLI